MIIVIFCIPDVFSAIIILFSSISTVWSNTFRHELYFLGLYPQDRVLKVDSLVQKLYVYGP